MAGTPVRSHRTPPQHPTAPAPRGRPGVGAPPGIVVCLGGRVTGPVARSCEDLVHRLWAGGPHPVSLDLAEVTLLTGAGIGPLVRCSVSAHRLGVGFTLRQVPPQPARLLRCAHLAHLIDGPDGHQQHLPGQDPAWSRLTGPRSWAGLPR